MTKELLMAVYKCVEQEITRDINTGERFSEDELDLICKARDEMKKELDYGRRKISIPLKHGYEIITEDYEYDTDCHEIDVCITRREGDFIDLIQDLVVITESKDEGNLDVRIYGDCNNEDYTEKFGIHILEYEDHISERDNPEDDPYIDSNNYAQLAWGLNQIISSMNNEEAYFGCWLNLWPDGESWEDCKNDFSNAEDYQELEDLFVKVYETYHDDGLFEATLETVQAAHAWDNTLYLDPIENIE